MLKRSKPVSEKMEGKTVIEGERGKKKKKGNCKEKSSIQDEKENIDRYFLHFSIV